MAPVSSKVRFAGACVCMCMCAHVVCTQAEKKVIESLPKPGTYDENEILVKYKNNCGTSEVANNRMVETHKSTGADSRAKKNSVFHRLSEFISTKYTSGNEASHGQSVHVDQSHSANRFYTKRSMTFTVTDVHQLSVPQAMNYVHNNNNNNKNNIMINNYNNMQVNNDVRIGLQQDTHGSDSAPLSITCEYQNFLNMDVCKIENLDTNKQNKITAKQVEEFLNSDPCVDFAEFSVQLKPPMHDEETKIVENKKLNFESSAKEAENLHDEPNDLYFQRYQWFLLNSHPYSINAQTAWDAFVDNSEGNANNTGVVGVMDTGAWMSYPNQIHRDLRDKMWRNEEDCDFDGVDSDKNGYIDDCNGWNFGANSNDLSDYHGHGTAVSGTVGAATDNRIGVSSIGWPVKIMTLKTYFRSSEFAKIMNYMSGFGVKIMNGSFAYARANNSLRQLVESGRENNMLMVFAASNENCNNDDIVNSASGRQTGCDLYPASLPHDNILSVCSSNERGAKSYFSSYGKHTVDVCAPGSSIFTTRFSSSADNQYGRSSGTSFAAPVVAGVAGLIAMQHPKYTYTEIAGALRNSCTSNSLIDEYSVCGGIVDAGKALQPSSP